MAIRNILKNNEDTLKKKCRQQEKFDDRLAQLLDDMYETMMEANGVGLAAPQVGILRRVVVIDVDREENSKIELVNPVIIDRKGEQIGREGCLSIPNRQGIVNRPYYVKVKAQDRYGKEFEISGEGFLARAFAHELDHLDGVLYTDIMERWADMDDDDDYYDDEIYID